MSIFPEALSELHATIEINWITNLTYFKLHRHNFLEFLYVVEGEGEEYVNNVHYSLTPGTFSLILPYQLHMLKNSALKPIKFYCVAVNIETIFNEHETDEIIKELFLIHNDAFTSNIRFEDFKGKRIKEFLDEMYKESVEKNKWWEFSLKAKLTEILIEFSRSIPSAFMENKLTNTDTDTNTHHHNNILSDIIYYIYTNYYEEITLSHLSKQFNLSPNYISSSFCKIFGENYIDFLKNIRLKHACALLISTEMKITDIALSVGYKSYRTFVRAFQESIGATPGNYRKNWNNNK